jgi:hypothetical protein
LKLESFVILRVLGGSRVLLLDGENEPLPPSLISRDRWHPPSCARLDSRGRLSLRGRSLAGDFAGSGTFG